MYNGSRLTTARSNQKTVVSREVTVARWLPQISLSELDLRMCWHYTTLFFKELLKIKFPGNDTQKVMMQGIYRILDYEKININIFLFLLVKRKVLFGIVTLIWTVCFKISHYQMRKPVRLHSYTIISLETLTTTPPVSWQRLTVYILGDSLIQNGKSVYILDIIKFDWPSFENSPPLGYKNHKSCKILPKFSSALHFLQESYKFVQE